jgi:hypothetical protein
MTGWLIMSEVTPTNWRCVSLALGLLMETGRVATIEQKPVSIPT